MILKEDLVEGKHISTEGDEASCKSDEAFRCASPHYHRLLI